MFENQVVQMKKAIITGIVIFCLLSMTVGCSNGTSAPNTLLPQVMLNDTIYYLDGGKKPNITVEQSDYLGEIASTVPLTQIPAENGQANFLEEPGAPFAEYENGIVVLWNDEWTLFVDKTELLKEE
jgi:hypothetical protein